MKPLFTLAILCLVIAPLEAQKVPMRHFTVDNGLPSNTVYFCMQDKMGYVWFATDAGVGRFDGSQFRHLTLEDGLRDNDVLSLYEDRKGRIWMLQYNLSPVYYQNGRIHDSIHGQNLMEIQPGSFFYGCIEDSIGNLWIIGMKDVLHISEQGVRHFKLPFYARTSFQHVDHKGGLYLNTAVRGVYIQGEVLQERKLSSQMAIQKVLAVGDKLFAFTGERGLLYPAKYNESFDSLMISETAIQVSTGLRDIKMLGRNCFVIEEGMRGIYEADPKSYRQIGPVLLADPSAGMFLKDSEGNYWINTLGSGVYCYLNDRISITNVETGLTTSNVSSYLRHPNGSEWFALDNGDLTIRENKKMKIVDWRPARQSWRLKELFLLPNGNVILTSDFGLGLFDEKGNLLKEQLLGSVKSALIDKQGNILVGSYNSADIYSPELEHLKRISNERTIALAVYRGGYVLGKLGGVSFQDAEGNLHSLTERHPLFENRINKVICSKSGAVFFCTYNNGLLVYYNQRIYRIGKEQGLSGNISRDIFEDERGSIWVSTNHGVFRINFNSSYELKGIRQYSSLDGLPGNEINQVIVSGDTVFVSSSAGFCQFRESDIRATVPPPVYIEEIRLNGHLINPAANKFRSDSNNIDFTCTALSIKSAGRNTFRYRLLGLHEEWRETAQRTISFAELRPGKYRFELMANTFDGTSSRNIGLYEFEIVPSWYETIWFKGLMVLVGLFLLMWIVNQRIATVRKKIKQKSELEKRMAELELQAVRARMNPHFIFNVLGSIQHYMNQADKRAANQYLSTFANLIRQTLQYSKKNTLLLKDEIGLLENYIQLEKMRFKDKFQYLIEMGIGVDAAMIEIPSMVLQPFIENSINHGLRHRSDNDGLLKIQFTKEAHQLHCCIEDNGIGIQASMAMKSGNRHASEGIGLTGSRIDVMNKLFHTNIRFAIRERPEGGTLVDLYIPLDL